MNVRLRRIGPDDPFRPPAPILVQRRVKHPHSLVLLPDDDTAVFSAENDGELYVVSLREGRVIATPHEHTEPVNHLCLADGGRLLLSASDDRTIRVWDTSTWRVIWVLTGHEDYVREVAAAGLVAVSGAEDGTVAVWDLATGRPRGTFHDHGRSVDHVAISPDGRRAATASRDNHVLLWDLAAPRLERTLYRSGQEVTPDAAYFVVGTNNSGVGHAMPPSCLAFDSSGRLYSADRRVIQWHPDDGAERLRFGWPDTRVESMATHPTRPILAVVTCFTVQICDPDGTRLASRANMDGWFVDAAFTSDERLVTLDTHGSIQVWPAHTPAEGADVRHPAGVTTIAVDPTGRYAATISHERDAMVWDLDSGERTAVVHGVRERMLFTSDGRSLVLQPNEITLLVQDTIGGTPRRLPPDGSAATEAATREPSVKSVVAIGDRSVLVLRSHGSAEVWRLDDGAQHRLGGTAGTPTDSAGEITPNRRYALVPVGLPRDHPALAPGVSFGRMRFDWNGGNAIQCWDLDAAELAWTRYDDDPSDDYPDHCWARVLDDRTALIPTGGADSTSLIFVDIPTNTVLRRIPIEGWHKEFDQLPDGRLLLTVAPELAILPPDGDAFEPHATIFGGTLRAVPDRDLLIYHGDAALRVYRLSTGTPLASLDVAIPSYALAVTPDGRTIVIGDRTGGVHLFRMDGTACHAALTSP